MTRATRRTVLAGLVLAWLTAQGDVPRAQAQEASPPSGSGNACIVSGTALVPKDTTIFGSVGGADRIAVFSGALAPMSATNFPADPNTSRAQVNTGNGFRVEGFADLRAVPVFGSRDVIVSPGHLWISAGVGTNIIGAAPGKVRVELPAGGGLNRAVQAWTGCDALSFNRVPIPQFEIPRGARGYVAQHGDLDLYDSAGGSVFHTLSISGEGNGLLLWGDTVQRGFLHVMSRSTVFIDAWVKQRDVKALPRGEMMDQLLPTQHYQNPPTLSIKDYVRELKAPGEVRIHAGRGDATSIIGAVERNTDLYVLETVLGWTAVLPKSLHVMPPGDRAFWVKAADLGLSAPGDAGADAK